jgi:benzoate membrane transport protein
MRVIAADTPPSQVIKAPQAHRMPSALASRLRDYNAAAMSGGIAISIIYLFAALPIQVAIFAQMGLTQSQASGWLFVTWLTSGAVSLAVAWHLRQPIAVTLSLPCLAYLGALGQQFTFAETTGALLLAGIIILALGVSGISARLLKLVPVPIVMGMFAGTLFSFVTKTVSAITLDLALAGPAILGYLVGHGLRNPRIPPIGLAVAFSATALLLRGFNPTMPSPLTAPQVSIQAFGFSTSAILAITLPMVLLTVAIGNIQGLAFLKAQGYPVRPNLITSIAGLSSILNAIFGGHTAGVGQSAVAIGAAGSAGPARGRYWAITLPSIVALAVAFVADPVIAIVSELPRAAVLALAGLAMLSPMQTAIDKAFNSRLKFGALVAFAVAATPFTLVGLSSGIWALLGGILASVLSERADLLSSPSPVVARAPASVPPQVPNTAAS